MSAQINDWVHTIRETQRQRLLLRDLLDRSDANMPARRLTATMQAYKALVETQARLPMKHLGEGYLSRTVYVGNANKKGWVLKIVDFSGLNGQFYEALFRNSIWASNMLRTNAFACRHKRHFVPYELLYSTSGAQGVMIQPMVKGMDLGNYILRYGVTKRWMLARRKMLQVLKLIHGMYTEGHFCHGDLHAWNVKVDAKGTVVILDYDWMLSPSLAWLRSYQTLFYNMCSPSLGSAPPSEVPLHMQQFRCAERAGQGHKAHCLLDLDNVWCKDLLCHIHSVYGLPAAQQGRISASHDCAYFLITTWHHLVCSKYGPPPKLHTGFIRWFAGLFDKAVKVDFDITRLRPHI